MWRGEDSFEPSIENDRKTTGPRPAVGGLYFIIVVVLPVVVVEGRYFRSKAAQRSSSRPLYLIRVAGIEGTLLGAWRV